MKENKKIPLGSIIGFVVFFAVAVKVYYELKWYDLLLGITKLTIGGKEIALVSQKTLMFVTKKANAEEALKHVMAKNSWNFVDRFGMGYIFTNGEEELLLKRRDFSFGYVVFEVYPREQYRRAFKD